MNVPDPRNVNAKPGAACILVVDDNVLNCELFDAMLSPQGYRVEQAYSGTEALQMVDDVQPDLILLDVNMPGMDGFEVARRLREGEGTNLIPVVMVTALGDLDHRVRGLESGADDYIAKPVSRSELLARVQSKLRFSYLHQQVDERQKLELVLDDVSDGILIIDAAARVREASPSARRLLGLDGVRREWPLDELWGELQGAPPGLAQQVARGEACDFVLERREPVLYLAANMRPVHDPEGNSSGAVLSLRDVTRSILDHKLQQDVLAMVSHKFRTPLTVTSLWTKVLLEESCGALNDEQRQALTAIHESTETLSDLLERMLSYLEWTRRLQRMQRGTLAFEAIERELIATTSKLLDAEHRLLVERKSEGEIVVDEGLFIEVLTELVRNAVKFSPERVEIRLTMATTAGRAVIRFEDDGPGIPPEHLDNIFERFHQIEEDFTGQVRGLGLGLPMVKAALDAMGAKLEVHSQLKRGTSFTIRF